MIGLAVRSPTAELGAAARRLLVVGLGGAMLVLGAGFAGQGALIYLKARLAQVLLERAFEATVRNGAPARPWPWADMTPAARVSIPRVGAEAIVLSRDSGEALAFGPGQVGGTPVAGEPGLTVYAAHRDTHFAFLARVRVGDEIDVTRRDGRRVMFRVIGMSVVRRDGLAVDPAATQSELALVTCWPLNGQGHGPWRYVVRAARVG